MDFRRTEEQLALYKSVKDFATEVVEPGAHERDVEGRFDRGVWTKRGDFGLLGLPVPKEFGGSGADIITTCLALEALAEGGHDAGLGLSVGAHVTIGALPIWLHGTDEQKRRYLPKLTSGQWVGAMAITEPGVGSDAATIECKATRDGDEWVLNGSKIFITSGSIADTMIVMAVTDPDASGHGGAPSSSRGTRRDSLWAAISTRRGRACRLFRYSILTTAGCLTPRCSEPRAARCGRLPSSASIGSEP
ncbi:MAG: acyl-CoA dehydrogenase family protein [Actinomycetota bacterium]|nr:acyl-CoA dehydrogenase family protein [Actinomycetota bacterium]